MQQGQTQQNKCILEFNYNLNIFSQATFTYLLLGYLKPWNFTNAKYIEPSWFSQLNANIKYCFWSLVISDDIYTTTWKTPSTEDGKRTKLIRPKWS